LYESVDKQTIKTGKNKLIQLPSVCFYGLNIIFQLGLPWGWRWKSPPQYW